MTNLRCYFDTMRTNIILKLKANNSVYIVPRYNKLFSSEPDTGGRISLATFLAEQKREYDAQR